MSLKLNLIHFSMRRRTVQPKFDRLFRCFDPPARHSTEAKRKVRILRRMQGVIYPVSHRSLRIKFWALRTNCETQSKIVRIKKVICEAAQSMHRTRFAAACAIAIACTISRKLRSAATAQPGAGPELASSGLLLITRSFLILAHFGTARQGDLLGDAAFSRWKTFSKWQ